MANYLPIMLMPTAMNWFTSLAPNSIGSWEELKKVFTDNYMATCTRPGTKHDLNCITQNEEDMTSIHMNMLGEPYGDQGDQQGSPN